MVGYDGKLKRCIPWTDKSLRDMGSYIIDAFSKFLTSSLKSAGIYNSDYNTHDYKSAGVDIDICKRGDHAALLDRLACVLEDREVAVDMNCIIESMQRYEECMPADDYSEGGSDSEFSDEDLEGAERRVLLNNIADYTKSYASGAVAQNFTSKFKKEILKVTKKKKNEVEDFVKLKEQKRRFDQLEKYGGTEPTNQSLKPEIKIILPTKPNDELTFIAKQEESFQQKIAEVTKGRQLPEVKSNLRRSMHRDNTMPHLPSAQNKIASKSTVISTKESANPSQSIFTKYNYREVAACRQIFREFNEDHSIPYYSVQRKKSEDKDVQRLKRMVKASQGFQIGMLQAPQYSKLDVPLPSVRHQRPGADLRDRIANSLLDKDGHKINSYSKLASDYPRALYSNPITLKRKQEPVTVKIHTIELNVIQPPKPVLYRPKATRCPSTKFYVKAPDFT